MDGNGYNFPDNLIREGFNGGLEAAQNLRSHAQAYLKQVLDVNQLNMLVRVFINLDGLSGIYQGLGIVSDGNTIRDFMVGFVQAQSLFDVIDVGKGEKAVSHKMKGMWNGTVGDQIG